MKSRVLATGLSLALAMGACSKSPQETVPTPDYGPVTADSWLQNGDRQTLTDAYKAVVAHFVGKGIARAADIRLVLLEGKETFRCDDHTTVTANNPDARYCVGGSLIINATFVNIELTKLVNQATDDPQKRQAVRTAIEQFVVGHEFGHAIQEMQGASSAPPAIFYPSREPQADCFGGQFMETYAPEGLDDVALFLSQLTERDLWHGTPEVRIGATNLGASGSECAQQEIVALRDSIEARATPSPQPQVP